LPGRCWQFLSTTHYSQGNRIVGGGFLSGWASLPMSRAWEFFGEDNGCASEVEMRQRIGKYRGTLHDARNEPEIGCSSYVEDVLRELLQRHLTATADGPSVVAGEVFGAPRLTPTRVGQAAFKALVQEAYGRRCAVTGDKIVPVLQAAHIRPVTLDGENRVDNGLLLRSDVHTLFDCGYLGVHPESRRLLVSSRLRADWGNGEEFYHRAQSDQPISVPARRADHPNRDFLTWHADTVFLAS
jgi:putative restriction endonuclease